MSRPVFCAFAADYQRQHGNGQGSALKFWTTARVAHHARRARDDWSFHVPAHARPRLSLLDLNHLAHTLVTCGEAGANLVCEEIGPLATSAPWAQVSGSLGRDWQTEFRRLRDAACRQGARYR